MTKTKIPAEVKKAVDTANKQTKRTNRTGQRKQQTAKRREIFDMAVRQLGEEQAVGIWGERKFVDSEDYIFEGRHIKILPVKLLGKEDGGKTIKHRNGFYAVFDVDKCQLNSEVVLKAPAGRAAMFVGTKGWQLREWCKKLGLKKIVVE